MSSESETEREKNRRTGKMGEEDTGKKTTGTGSSQTGTDTEEEEE